MKRRNAVAVIIFVVFYVTFGAYITLNQEKIIYQPWEQDFELCIGFGDAEKVVQNGTRMYVLQGELGTVVLYHGNAGSACDRAFYADMFTRAGYGYIFVEYAGYSNDRRSTTHELVKKDVRNVISYLQEQNIDTVLVVGESIGTGAASYHASVYPPKKLLLISPFTSLADVAQRRFWFYPTAYMIDNVFNNIELLSQFNGEVTIIHGEEDVIIPQQLGRELYEKISSSRKEFVSIATAGHNNIFSKSETYAAVNAFLVLR